MRRLAFLADEHVNRSSVSALRSNGFRVAWLDDGAYDPGAGDLELLERARRDGLVTKTSDNDFVATGETVEHVGVIVNQQYGHSLRGFVRAVTRIDRYFDAEEFRDHVEWWRTSCKQCPRRRPSEFIERGACR